MNRFLGRVVFAVGLVACTRTPDPAARATSAAVSSAAVEASPVASTAPAAGSAAPAESAGGRSGRVGGRCEYDDTPGTATVTAVEDAPGNGDCRNHPKRVTLKFVADDAAAKPNPKDDAFALGVGGVDFVAAGCLAAYKISVGAKLKTVRHIIKAGTCSPHVYEVTALSSPDDIEKCVGFCNK